MKLAWLVALVIACGSSAAPREVAHHAPDDRLIIERFEIRGVLDGRAAELRALVRTHIAPGIEITTERYDDAHHAITNDYLDRGYAQVKLTWPDFDKLRGPFALVLEISEGRQFRFTTLDVAGVSDPDRARYLALATMKPGDVFNRSKQRAWVRAVVDAAGADVEPEVTLDPTAATIAVTLHLEKAP